MYELISSGEILDLWGTLAVNFIVTKLVSLMEAEKQEFKRGRIYLY